MGTFLIEEEEDRPICLFWKMLDAIKGHLFPSESRLAPWASLFPEGISVLSVVDHVYCSLVCVARWYRDGSPTSVTLFVPYALVFSLGHGWLSQTKSYKTLGKCGLR